MAVSTIKLKSKLGWSRTVLAQGITQYINRDTKMCCLMLNGYSVLGSSSAGNAGNILETLPEDAICPVVVVGYGPAVFKIASNGELSLMNASLGAYIAGSVYGVALFPIN